MSWIILLFVLFLVSIKNRGSDKKMKVSVVIPAYNEHETVGNVVNVIKKLSYINEIIVVDDGSTDNTGDVAANAGAMVITHLKNRGKGAAIKAGFKNSTGDIVAFIDADLHNLTPKQAESIIKPILDGNADVTKTKFKRQAGRVTELTAKPLLSLFFPEIKFDQPLSGQFAARRTFLSDIKLEEDYGVDVGIVLDADVRGMRIKEVDIGEVDHSMSTLNELNSMANEVVRTIVDKAMEYGRFAMMDTLGSYIRMSILGLSLITLGLFQIFFINKVPGRIGIIISIIGLIIALFYTARLIKRAAAILSKSDGRLPTIRSLMYMHSPILISGLILLAMIFTFVSGMHFTKDGISIQPASGNLVFLWKSPTNNGFTGEIRGPYTVDSALEGDNNTLRVPSEAMSTLDLNYGDSVYIKGKKYNIAKTRPGEDNTLRIPSAARTALGIDVSKVIQDGDIKNIFRNIYIEKSVPVEGNISNLTINEGVFIRTSSGTGRIINIYVDDKKVATTNGILTNDSYTLYINGIKDKTIEINTDSIKNPYYTYLGKHTIKIEIGGEIASDWAFATSTEGKFLNITL